MKMSKFLLCILFMFIIFTVSKAQNNPAGENMVGEKVTKRVGSLIGIKPEWEERYIILHRNIFPGVIETIRNSNIRNYSIFMKNGILFSYFEYIGNDYESDLKAMSNTITIDWWKLTDPMQQPLPDKKENEWWAVMDQLFSMGKKLKASEGARRFGLAGDVISGKEEELKKLCENIPAELETESNKYSFQDCNLFFKDGKVYYYYEYIGNDIQKSYREISQNLVFQNFQKELIKYLQLKGDDYWDVMEEVFHTN